MFKKKTVASILSKYNGIVEELRNHLDNKMKEADNHKRIIAEAQVNHAEAVNEANVAMRVVENFEKLLGIK